MAAARTSRRPTGLLRPPEPRAPLLYRALLAFFRRVARVLGFQLVLEGAEHLPRDANGAPAGGWIAAGLPHRTWIDPFVLVLLLPIEPRPVFLGDGRAIFRSPLRRFAFRLLGGVVPIWPGGGRHAFGAHVEAAESVIRAGAVFAIFPEVGPPVPVDRARPLGAGVGYFALRTGAPVVPLVIGGGHELYLGRRIVLRVLAPLSARRLAGLAEDGELPPVDSPAERDAAHRMTAALHELTARDVAETHVAAEPGSTMRKRGRWLTGLFH
jgi:1-acyl-sn-glycerol-3-phosphate acyltransferase